MATITTQQAMSTAAGAGFTGNAQKTIVAIATAESGLNTMAQGQNVDGSVDRGILQINNKWHPEVTDSCAYSAICAFKAAYKISKSGTDFTPWSTFTSNLYQKYLAAGTTAPITIGAGQTPWFAYHVTQPYGLPYEPGLGGHHGIDLATPLDTPITAVLPGTIASIDTQSNWGIEVGIKLDTPFNGATYMNIIHMDAVAPGLAVGQHVVGGTMLGWSGGENSQAQIGSAHNPTGTHFIDSPSMSGGPHTHLALTMGPVYGHGAGWDDPTKYPNLNPQGLLNDLNTGKFPQPGGAPTGSTGQPSSPLPTGSSGETQAGGFSNAPIAITYLNNAYMAQSENAHKILQSTPGFYGIVSAVDEAEQFPGIYNAFSGDSNPLDAPSNTIMTIFGTINNNLTPLAIRSMLVLLGFLLIIGLLLKSVEPLMDAAGVDSGDVAKAAVALV